MRLLNDRVGNRIVGPGSSVGVNRRNIDQIEDMTNQK